MIRLNLSKILAILENMYVKSSYVMFFYSIECILHTIFSQTIHFKPYCHRKKISTGLLIRNELINGNNNKPVSPTLFLYFWRFCIIVNGRADIRMDRWIDPLIKMRGCIKKIVVVFRASRSLSFVNELQIQVVTYNQVSRIFFTPAAACN